MRRLLLLLACLLLLCSCQSQKLTGTPPPPAPPPDPLTEEAPPTADPELPLKTDPLPPLMEKQLFLNGKKLQGYEENGVIYAEAEALCRLLGGHSKVKVEDGQGQSLRLSLPEGTFLFSTEGSGTEHCLFTDEVSFLLPCDFLQTISYRRSEQADRLLLTLAPTADELSENTEVPVLMYHAVSNDCWGIRELFVSPENMEQQLSWLLEEGYTPIFFEDLPQAARYEKPVLLTFDDGYDDNYLHLFPLLQKYQVKANVFIITENVGKTHFLTEEQILEMDASGLVSFQSHTATHPYLDELSETRLREEFSRSKEYLQALLNKEPFVLCYPSGRYSSLALQVAKEYYSFGLLMSGGKHYSTADDPFLVRRDYVARSTTMSDLKKMLRY